MPFAYGGDAVFTGALIKGLIEGGSFMSNSATGMPGGTYMYDYPSSDGIHVLLLRLIGLLTRDYAVTMNLYYLLGFPLAALTAYVALRLMKASRLPAMTAAILYSVLPFHFMRGEAHFFLSQYWIVPLAVLLCVWLVQGQQILFAETGSWAPHWRNARVWGALTVALMVGQSGIYYAFFTCFLLLVAGVTVALRKRSLRRFIASVVLIAVISASMIAGISGSIRYWFENGQNAAAVIRAPISAEVYGLRISQLILPLSGDRFIRFQRIKDAYNAAVLAVGGSINESDSSSLGIVLALGFVGLVGIAVLGNDRTRGSTIGSLALLNLASVLLATTAGFGLLFAFLVPQIRGYNRISVFIAFCSAALVALVLTRLQARIQPRLLAVLLVSVLCAGTLLLGVYDQTTPGFSVDNPAVRAAYNADDVFVKTLESELPEGAMIFQLPYVPFPENPPVGAMGDYEHFRPYLHSKTLRWSYGAIKGRDTDAWQEQVSSMPTEDFISVIREAGFKGIWLNTTGYEGGGVDKIAELESTLHVAPQYNADRTIAFFALQP
ncbi:MAG: hypothetical protein HGA39_05150 [Coriobacteriia bacterium]|nr:hypothetical protein [Coriobacteriia bacterium]